MEISKFDAQKKLSIFWLVNAAILAVIFILFTIFDRFDDQAPKGWEWYSQNIIPVSTLMLGSFFTNLNDPQIDKRVNVFFYKLSFGISIFYISILYLTIFLAPIAFRYADTSIIELFNKSRLYLILIQGLVTFSLGFFFNKQG